MAEGLSLPWWLALPAALMWVGLLLLPWQPWRMRERLEPQTDTGTDSDTGAEPPELHDVTVLIPARDEAECIDTTLSALRAQGRGLRIVVVDDQSRDGTADIARRHEGVTVVPGQPLPEGWSGKLWALEQGRAHLATPLCLLLDADIALQPGMLAALLAQRRRSGAQLVSLMADLKRNSFWDRLLLPAFVYYFKLLYPFALSNGRGRLVAAAAGGCVLVEREALERIGAFASLRDALIDDCTLARRVKQSGFRTWTGVSRGVVSLRGYGSLASIHDMVARTAFTQLFYSTTLLLALTALFAVAYWLPVLGLLSTATLPWAAIALLAMMAGYLPTLRYYRLSPTWALTLPLAGTLYLGMSWSSAIRYWRGTRSRWKARDYSAQQAP